MKALAALAAVLAGVFLAGVAYGLARPALAVEAVNIGGGAGLAALLTAGFMLGRGAASVASGLLSEAPGRRRLLLSAGPLMLSSLLLAAAPALPGPQGLVVVAALWGVLSGLAWPSVQVSVAALASGVGSGKILAVYFALGGLGVGAGGKLLAEISLQPGELLLAAAAVLAAASVMVAVGAAASRGLKPASRAARSGAGVGSIIALAALASLAAGALIGVLGEFYYAYSIEQLGWGVEGLGNAIALAGVLEVAAGLAAGALMDRLGLPPALTLALASGAASTALLALAPEPLWYAAASASARATMPLTRNAAAVERRGGLLVGLSNASSNLGMTLGPLAAAAAYEALGPSGAETALLVIAAMLALLASASLVLYLRGSEGGIVILSSRSPRRSP